MLLKLWRRAVRQPLQIFALRLELRRERALRIALTAQVYALDEAFTDLKKSVQGLEISLDTILAVVKEIRDAQ